MNNNYSKTSNMKSFKDTCFCNHHHVWKNDSGTGVKCIKCIRTMCRNWVDYNNGTHIKEDGSIKSIEEMEQDD